MGQTQTLDPKQGRPDPDGTFIWYDCQLLDVEGRGWTDTESYYDRLPAKAQQTVREPVWNLSHHSASMAVRFTTDATSLRVRWTCVEHALNSR